MNQKQLEAKIKELEKRIDFLERVVEDIHDADDRPDRKWMVRIKDTGGKPGTKYLPMKPMYADPDGDWTFDKKSAMLFTNVADATSFMGELDVIPRHYSEKGLAVVDSEGNVYKEDEDDDENQ